MADIDIVRRSAGGTGPWKTEPERTSSGGSETMKRVRFDFTYATANLDAGVVAYTPAAGEALLDGWFEGTVNFDGTTPKADFGTFVGASSSGLGFYGNVNVAVDLATVADAFVLCGDGLNIVSSDQGSIASLYSGDLVGPPVVSDGTPIKVVASQDGAQGGTAIDSTAGAATLVLLIVAA